MTWFDGIIPVLIYAAVGITAVCLPLKIMLNSHFFKEKAKAKTIEAKERGRGPGLIGKARDLMETAPEKLDQINRELDHLQKTGATEQQMANLKFEKKIVEMANHPIAQLAAEPLIQIVSKVAKGWGINI